MSASSSPASVTFSFRNQPRPAGSSLTVPGVDFELAVHRDHFAGDRRVDFARGLHALDDGGLGALVESLADARQLHEDDIAELRLRVVGDPDDVPVSPSRRIYS